MPYVPIEWLASHVDVAPGTTAEQVAAALVRVGLEEEAIVPPTVTGPLVVGRVLTLDSQLQSNGKTINYCRVDVGEHNDAPGEGKEPSELPSRGIVCGAHNFKVGDHVVVCLPGAVLPGPFPISARKTYGHVSDGMICSLRELGLGEDHDGIIVLEDYLGSDTEIPAPGSDMLGPLGLSEENLEINVTPDRGYCFSMRGVAREYSHSTGAKFTDPGLPSSLREPLARPSESAFEVIIDDDGAAYPAAGLGAGCDRFVTRVVEGLDPQAPTPKWITKRLLAAGMRPISLAVDITNYVMLDLGQPLHAYDLGQLNGPIVVRRARQGERLTTLDEVDRALDPEDLLITDCEGGYSARPLGLAGVMGGYTGEVCPTTTSVLIEAAHFDPVTVARSARRHKLPSEAAKRFERGTDPQLCAVAAQRVVELLVEYGGGRAGEAVGDVDNTAAPQVIDFDPTYASRLVGVDYPAQRVRELLVQIGADVEETAGGIFAVTPPSWRPDLTGSADLVEEVARLDGYDSIDSVLAPAPAGTGLSAVQRRRRDIARTIAERGSVQVLSYPFVGDTHDRQGIEAGDPRRRAVRLANPLAEDAPYMRTSVLDSLLDTARRNVSRGAAGINLFELGMVTRTGTLTRVGALPGGQLPDPQQLEALAGAVPAQPLHGAGVLAGYGTHTGPLHSARAYDWADAIELVLSMGSVVGVDLVVEQGAMAPWHPGRTAVLKAGGSTVVGYAGELHPAVCKAFELPARTCAWEIDLDVLLAQAGGEPIAVKPVSTYPVAKEDLALVVDVEVPVSAVLDAVKKGGGKLLEEVALFDVYRGPQVPEGKKSVAVALRLRAEDRTLSADEIAGVRKKILGASKYWVGASLRA